MDFSAPPDAYGHAGVLTPEDAFVAAANTCVMMMFLWACERFKLDLVSYDCRVEGTKKIELDRTELFTHLRFWPEVTVRVDPTGDAASTEKRVCKALAAAHAKIWKRTLARRPPNWALTPLSRRSRTAASTPATACSTPLAW